MEELRKHCGQWVLHPTQILKGELHPTKERMKKKKYDAEQLPYVIIDLKSKQGWRQG